MTFLSALLVSFNFGMAPIYESLEPEEYASAPLFVQVSEALALEASARTAALSAIPFDAPDEEEWKAVSAAFKRAYEANGDPAADAWVETMQRAVRASDPLGRDALLASLNAFLFAMTGPADSDEDLASLFVRARALCFPYGPRVSSPGGARAYWAFVDDVFRDQEAGWWETHYRKVVFGELMFANSENTDIFLSYLQKWSEKSNQGTWRNLADHRYALATFEEHEVVPILAMTEEQMISALLQGDYQGKIGEFILENLFERLEDRPDMRRDAAVRLCANPLLAPVLAPYIMQAPPTDYSAVQLNAIGAMALESLDRRWDPEITATLDWVTRVAGGRDRTEDIAGWFVVGAWDEENPLPDDGMELRVRWAERIWRAGLAHPMYEARRSALYGMSRVAEKGIEACKPALRAVWREMWDSRSDERWGYTVRLYLTGETREFPVNIMEFDKFWKKAAELGAALGETL